MVMRQQGELKKRYGGNKHPPEEKKGEAKMKFEKWSESFEEHQEKRENRLELEQYLRNWEEQSGYDEYRWHANWNGLPLRKEYW